MTLSWRLVEFAMLSGFVVGVSLAALAALSQRLLLHLLATQPAAQRARCAGGILIAPVLIGGLYAGAILLMSSFDATSASITAACTAHHGSWLHACLVHTIEAGSDSWLWLALVGLLLVCAGLLFRVGRALLRARRQRWALIRLGSRHEGHGQLHVLDTDAPLAVACDVGGGHVLLAGWLLEVLRPEQLRVVLAHERAHLVNRDMRWRLLAQIASGLHFPVFRRRLLASLELACEQRCDQAAADDVGSRLLVAETLLAVERLYRQRQSMRQSALAMAFGTEFLRERIEALLAVQRDRTWPLGSSLMALTALGVLASAGWVHNLSEFIVTLLVI